MTEARMVLASVLALCLAGCARERASTSLEVLRSSPAVWRHAGGAFSALYVGEPPAGEHLEVVLVPDLDDPCSALYEADEAVEELDFWYMKIEAAQRASGAYSVVGDDDLGVHEARVSLIHAVEGRKAERLDAVGGEVVVDGAAWESGAELDIDVVAEFPEDWATTVECSSDVSMAGVQSARTCVCELDDGSRSECETTLDESCCRAPADAGTVVLRIGRRATFCSAMCGAIVGLEGHCAALQ